MRSAGQGALSGSAVEPRTNNTIVSSGRMSDPTTPEGWLEVASNRAADADAMMPARSLSSGPVYMAGYAIEASLKAYLTLKGIPRPARGPGGHNLKGLWKASGFRLRDLNDVDGSKSFYISDWGTHFRYTAVPQFPLPCSALLDAAKKLTSWIQTHCRRTRRRS
jgi:hypothetical protein